MINTNITQSEKTDLLFTALSNASLELFNPSKSASGYGYKYAPLDAITNDTRPILAKHGLSVIQLPVGGGEDEIGILTQLNHTSGQYFGAIGYVKVFPKKGQEWIQSVGTYFTYYRRYAVQQLLFLAAEEDTDGNQKAPVDPPKPRKPETNKAADKTVKHSPKTEDLVKEVNDRLEKLNGYEWAAGTGFNPSKTSAFNLKRFLNLSDDQVKGNIASWKEKQAA